MRDKQDDRPQRGAWAPGNYLCTCCTCHADFIGDKRAMTCADCAYDPNPAPPQYVHHICAWMIEQFSKRWRGTP